MKSIAIYSAIVNSIPSTRELHGSTKTGCCNNAKCERNGGSEKHKLTMDEFNKKVKNRYAEIVREW